MVQQLALDMPQATRPAKPPNPRREVVACLPDGRLVRSPCELRLYTNITIDGKLYHVTQTGYDHYKGALVGKALVYPSPITARLRSDTLTG